MQDLSTHTTTSQTLPLALVSQGERIIIEGFQGGRKLRQRLLDLGLNQGAKARVIKNEMQGPMIIAVKEDGRLALGRGMSHHIMVSINHQES
ncbi:ferrous iron transport protein A [bacterium]|nr:ferrous iron transport protein A [bacterium]